ncbi:MAG: LPS-assembly protein LptD [Desulfomonile tiedjei]|uniref:LPS-assembly protein LptD n=1 Tax=Desulfomonile tiedjei TaxID=2358 RepID=A0A9D6UXA9_9BACT|nr:LPS-assembly protein LptD [Desulfomonile tiedjei]
MTNSFRKSHTTTCAGKRLYPGLFFRAVIVSALLLILASKSHSQDARSLDSAISSPSGQKSILPGELPIQISYERLSVSKQDNTYTATGNVALTQGNFRLRADSIVYSGNTGELTASGKVIVRMGGDVLEADKLTIMLKSATGILYDGKLLLTRHNIYLEGKKLEKTGPSSYRIDEGSFTTCDGAIPDWRIRGKGLDVTLEGYGVLKHGFFYIKDIPVFYLPWLVYPAKRKRQTGFLMPTLANSSLKGFDVRLPFFVDISPSIDATIVPRICTLRAAQVGLEFRYFPNEDFQGRFYGEYTHDWRYGSQANPKSHRFYVTWRHEQDIAAQLRLQANANWISDRDYFEFWGGKFDKRLRVRYLESNAVVYKQLNNFLFQAEARHFDNLDLPDNAVTVQNLPTVRAILFNQQIPYTPFYLSSDLVYNHYYAPLANKQWIGGRFQMDTRLSLPIALGRYLKIEPSMTYFPKAYLADYYQGDKSVSSVKTIRPDLYQVKADVFTDLSAVYGSAFGFQRIKHSIRPRVAWTYRPFPSRQTYPYFDDSDRIDQASLLTAEMRSVLTGRLGQQEYLDFLTFMMSQGYDFYTSRSALDPSGERHPSEGSHWTNTRAELTVKPHSAVDFGAQTEYDPVFNRARKYSLNLGLMDHRGDLIRVLHQFTESDRREDLNRQTNVNLQVKLTSTLECFFENQFTHQFNFAYFTSFGLNYHPQCWSILLRYSEVREQDPVSQKIKEPDQTVFMTLSLYGLGQVYRFTRDWGEILGHSTEATSDIH